MMSRSGGAITVGNKGKSTGTVDGKREAQVLSQEAVRLFKTQDLAYVRTMRNQVRKEVETLERRLVGFGGGEEGGKGKKVVFCESVDEVDERIGDDESEEDEEDEEETPDEKEAKKQKKIRAAERDLRRLQRREKEKVENRLEVARQRLKALTEAETALDLQRAKMSKTPSIGGVNKDGVKFKVRGRKG